MALKASQLAIDGPAISKGVQWQPCVTKWNNFKATATLTRCPYKASGRTISGNISAVTRSTP